MKFAATAIVASVLVFGASGAADAATQNATGCPAGAWTTYAGGSTDGVSISWSFSGIGPVIAFQPAGIVYGGGVAPLTAAQVQGYAAALDNLRAAASARRQVTIFWDDATKKVSTIIVRWAQPC